MIPAAGWLLLIIVDWGQSDGRLPPGAYVTTSGPYADAGACQAVRVAVLARNRATASPVGFSAECVGLDTLKAASGR